MKLKILFIAPLSFLIHTSSYGQQEGDIIYKKGSSVKIEQLVGDWDNQLQKATRNQTNSRYGVHATDLGVPFKHKGKTFVAFGDIPPTTYDRDPLAFTEDINPEDGIDLDFVTNPDGSHKPIDIPGISMKGFEVPMEGVSWDDNMYIYFTTDHMGRSVVAKSIDDGHTFTKLYDFSDSRFVNVSLVKTISDSNYPEIEGTDIQVMVGSGTYRQSSVYLAYQTADKIEEKELHYLKNVTADNSPVWSSSEVDAAPIFSQPCVGELSLSYNKFIDKWILLYNCETPRGINCRVADNPWGPWSESFVIFDPVVDNGYCHFMHSNWESEKCDTVHDPDRENEWGGEYGAYQFEDLATGDESSTTIYYTLSTWNPYTVVLMKSTLQKYDPSILSVEMEESYTTICPNPANNTLKIKFDKRAIGKATIILRDISGKTLREEQIQVLRDYDYVLDTSEILEGTYTLEVYLLEINKVLNQKILISH